MKPIHIEQGYPVSYSNYDIDVKGSKPMSESRSGVHAIDGDEEVNIVDVD